jgi:two-component system alkaline phosphatase synthesis response regulator PhoP
MKIFIVEDDHEIRELETYAIKNSGFDTEAFGDGASALAAMEHGLPSLVLLDIMLPGIDGLEVLRRIRANPKTAKVPVIMVTAKATELDKVRGLDLGADDYMTKPFGIMELISRVKARLRRAESAQETSPLSYREIEMDDGKHSVTAAGEKSELTLKEYELLRLLLENQGRVLTREHITETVWGYDYEGNTRTVDMHIKTLRRKLGDCGRYISTVRGIGYTLEG